MGGERLKSGAEGERAWLSFVRNVAIKEAVGIDGPYSGVGGTVPEPRTTAKVWQEWNVFGIRKFGVSDYSYVCY